MLYLIGLGLNEKGISLEGIEAVKQCRKVYLENYTVKFPYSVKNLEKIIEKKLIPLEREHVESNFLIKEAKNNNVALLVYGSPLFATTHINLINECGNKKIKYKIIYSSSVFDALAETGLQLYKFGKISSMPKWQKNYQPTSFLDYVIENKKINAHSLILIDIGLECNEALEQLENSIENFEKIGKSKFFKKNFAQISFRNRNYAKFSIKKRNLVFDKMIVCSQLGTNKAKIFYGTINKLKKKKILEPFCFIILGKMHFVEREIIEKAF